MKESIMAITGVTSIMLFLALFDMPYDYYTILKIVVFVASLIIIYITLPLEKHWLMIIFSMVTIIFNPFIKISFHREVWPLINVVVGLMFIYGGYVVHKQK